MMYGNCIIVPSYSPLFPCKNILGLIYYYVTYLPWESKLCPPSISVVM